MEDLDRETFAVLVSIDVSHIGATVVYGLIELESILRAGAAARGYKAKISHGDKGLKLSKDTEIALSATLDYIKGNK